MPDMEKVIRGLECCSNPKQENCNCCPYRYPLYPKGDRNVWLASCQQLYTDALALLKEQEEQIGVLKRAITQRPKPVKLLDVFGNGYAKVVRCKDCRYCTIAADKNGDKTLENQFMNVIIKGYVTLNQTGSALTGNANDEISEVNDCESI